MSLLVWSRLQNASGPRLLPLHAAVARTTPASQEATTGPRMDASQAVATPANRAWSANSRAPPRYRHAYAVVGAAPGSALLRRTLVEEVHRARHDPIRHAARRP